MVLGSAIGLDLTTAERRAIYDSTGGYCHLCHKKTYWTNYGQHGKRGAWEIDHSNARANGGTDRLNNLRPAHTRCNRKRQDLTVRPYRDRNGVQALPPSREKRRYDAAVKSAIAVGTVVIVILGIAAFWLTGKLAGRAAPTSA